MNIITSHMYWENALTSIFFQNTFPLRFREIHILNESYLFDIVYTLTKPFLSERIRNRVIKLSEINV